MTANSAARRSSRSLECQSFETRIGNERTERTGFALFVYQGKTGRRPFGFDLFRIVCDQRFELDRGFCDLGVGFRLYEPKRKKREKYRRESHFLPHRK